LDRLHLINVFVAVVDCQGFAGAARKLDLSPPAVTRAINELETHLGVRLLTRTTRIVKVTEAGERYAEDCRAILAQLNDADESASGLHGTPRGRLTITAPVGFGALYVTPVVTEYLARYPEVTASCWFMDRAVNMLDEGVDVGVRIGHLPDSSMQAISVGRMRLLVCAAPSYLEQHGEPRTPDDLGQHTIIAASGVTSTSEWRMSHQGTPSAVKLQPRLIASTADTAIAAALNGFGLTNVLAYKVADHLREGRLKTVLGHYEPPALPVHVLHREGRHASQKARTFIDLAVERLRPRLATL
jgi:DNA-binding transcriptional LysR family regulator